MKKQNRGITLIALIITIVVMLILVGVVVSTTINSDLLSKTKKAGEDWKKAEGEEKDIGEITVDGKKYGSLQEYLATINIGYSGGVQQPVEEEKESPLIGYYADIDRDDKVDGIIYADIAFNEESHGEYSEEEYLAQMTDYEIVEQEYQHMAFNKKPVIAPKTVDNDETNDKFYIMALKDFTTEPYTDEEDESKSYPAYTTYYFYKNAAGKMDPLVTTEGFSSTECVGRKNTKAMIEIWGENGSTEGYEGATQDNQDIWKHIGTEVANGWFIPSKAEWFVFLNFAIDQGLTMNKDLTNFGLSYSYLSSNQCNAKHAWRFNFDRGCYVDLCRSRLHLLCAFERDFLIV